MDVGLTFVVGICVGSTVKSCRYRANVLPHDKKYSKTIGHNL